MLRFPCEVVLRMAGYIPDGRTQALQQCRVSHFQRNSATDSIRAPISSRGGGWSFPFDRPHHDIGTAYAPWRGIARERSPGDGENPTVQHLSINAAPNTWRAFSPKPLEPALLITRRRPGCR